jgi:c-di-GMP-binding flagellar brake protein YcgR
MAVAWRSYEMSSEHVNIPGAARIAPVAPAEPEMTSWAERRRFLRVKPDVLSAMLTAGANRYVVAIRDISAGGALVVNAPYDLEVDDQVEMMVRLDDEIIDVRCRVARIVQDPISPAIGVEFIDLASGNTDKLLSYVSKLGMSVIDW